MDVPTCLPRFSPGAAATAQRAYDEAFRAERERQRERAERRRLRKAAPQQKSTRQPKTRRKVSQTLDEVLVARPRREVARESAAAVVSAPQESPPKPVTKPVDVDDGTESISSVEESPRQHSMATEEFREEDLSELRQDSAVEILDTTMVLDGQIRSPQKRDEGESG